MTQTGALVFAICVAASVAACSTDVGPLPEPPKPRPDHGYPVASRPECSDAVRKAVSTPDSGRGTTIDIEALRALAARGVTLNCSEGSSTTHYAMTDEWAVMLGPAPLDLAVLADRPDAVEIILKAGGDPSARWGYRGDRHPLQGALEERWGAKREHQEEIVSRLLAAGADPNARWCPFESRSDWVFPWVACTSDRGRTPLMAAVFHDRVAVARLLLKSGADPTLEDYHDGTVLDHVHSREMLTLLLPAIFPRSTSPRADAVRQLDTPHQVSFRPGPWDETALTREICGATLFLAAPVVLPSPAQPGSTSAPGEPRDPEQPRLRLLLELGADPNRRLKAGGVDWTPLSLALATRSATRVRVLLEHGADPNGRWCQDTPDLPGSPVHQRQRLEPPAGCTPETGTTPLGWCAMHGTADQLRVLLKHGADPTLRDWTGRTALDYARGKQRHTVVKLLSAR